MGYFRRGGGPPTNGTQPPTGGSNTSQSASNDGLIFEPDGIPEVCYTFREIEMTWKMKNVKGNLSNDPDGTDIRYEVCTEMPPKCFPDPNTPGSSNDIPLEVGKYTSTLDVTVKKGDQLLDLSNYPLVANYFNRTIWNCNEPCPEDELYPLTQMVYSMTGDGGGKAFGQLLQILCSNDGVEITFSFAYRCLQKKESCEGIIFRNCSDEIEIIQLGGDPTVTSDAAEAAAALLSTLYPDADISHEVDVVSQIAPRPDGPTGFWDAVTNGTDFVGLDTSEKGKGIEPPDLDAICFLLSAFMQDDCANQPDLNKKLADCMQSNFIEPKLTDLVTVYYPIFKDDGVDGVLQEGALRMFACACDLNLDDLKK